MVLKTVGLEGGLGCKPETKSREGEMEQARFKAQSLAPHWLSVALSKLLNPPGPQHSHL